MSVITREPFLLGAHFLGLPRPDRVMAVLCEEDAANPVPVFSPATTDALALLLDPTVALAVFTQASLILEDSERNAPCADELGTSYAVATWFLPDKRCLVVAADTARCDTAQHQLHMAQADQPSIARYQSAFFQFHACQQPYMAAAIKKLLSSG